MVSPRRMDLVGLVLAVCTAVWLGIAGAIRGGRPLPMIALVLACVLTVVVARRATATRALPVMLAIGAAPIVLSIAAGPAVLAVDPLGYTNASGALYLVSAGGLLTARSLVERPVARRLLELAVLVWLSMPLLASARTAILFAGLLVAAVLLVRRSITGRVLLVVGASGLVSALLVTVAVAASAYTPVGRSGLLHRVVDAGIGDLRILLWREALELVRTYPLTGVGPGRFSEVSALAAEVSDARWAHNEYLQPAAEAGVPGGILVLLLALWGFAYLWRTAGDLRVLPAVIVLTGITINASIDYIWHFPVVPLLLAALIGGAAGVGQTRTNAHELEAHRLPRHRVVATLALWALLLVPAAPLNPEGSVTNQAAWTEDPPGVAFTGIGGLRSLEPPTRLYQQLIDRGELSIELLLATHSLDQAGPARIISASDGTTRRNLTVGQEGDALAFRLRTAGSDENAVDSQVVITEVFDPMQRQHIVITSDDERVQVFLDGRPVWEGPGPRGAFDSWDLDYPLLVGNESTGNRGWDGELFLAAIYDRVLDDEEVAARHAETVGTVPPQMSEQMGAPILLHTFEDPEGPVAHDRAASDPAVDLLMPRRFPSPPLGPATLLDVERWMGSRLAAHTLIFGIWMAVVLVGRRPTSVRDAVIGIASGLVIVLAATILRYAGGRVPTVVDLVGAVLGCSLVAAAMLLRRSGGSAQELSRGGARL